MTTYTLFGQPASPATLVSDTTPYTMGMEFTLSGWGALTGIWFYSATGAGSLPNQCGIYTVSGTSQLVWNSSATWSGAAGSGWVKCTFDGSVTLAPGTAYKVCVYNADLGGTNWYSATSHYWDTGTGAGGLTSGIITAPNNAGADGGQDTFNTPTVAYPDTSFNAANYWVDVEVSVVTTFRLMDGVAGRPGVGSSVTTPPGLTAYTSTPFQAGTIWSVLTGGMWLEGYWWWVPTGGDTAAQKFCTWQRTSPSTQQVVPGSVVTSGVLTANSMNYIPLLAPIPLAIGTLYVAATGYQPAHGFPISNSQFGGGQPYVNGITNGPLVAWSDSTAGGTNNYVAPTSSWGLSQGVFGTNSSGVNGDPTLNFPGAGSGSSNFWMDVSVSDTAPVGYARSWRIWPNKYDAPGTGVDTAANYILGTEFTLSQACTLNNIWFYSPATATQLPTQCAIWNVNTTSMVAGTLKTSPGWVQPTPENFSGVSAFTPQADPTNYTLGNEFTLAYASTVSAIRFYSGSGATALPTAVSIYAVSTTLPVAGTTVSSPTWIVEATGAAATAGAGWISCALPAPVALAASTSYIAVVQGPGAVEWYSELGTTLPVTANTITVTNYAFIAASSLTYPTTTGTGALFGVDISITAEVTGSAGTGWLAAAYSGVPLPAGDYKTSVWNGAASPSGFNEYTIDYFISGYGQNGIATGPITVPNVTGATSPGQSTYQTNASTFVYPNQYVAAEGQSYWVDAEVTIAPPAPPGTLPEKPLLVTGPAVSRSANW